MDGSLPDRKSPGASQRNFLLLNGVRTLTFDQQLIIFRNENPGAPPPTVRARGQDFRAVHSALSLLSPTFGNILLNFGFDGGRGLE